MYFEVLNKTSQFLLKPCTTYYARLMTFWKIVGKIWLRSPQTRINSSKRVHSYTRYSQAFNDDDDYARPSKDHTV